MSHTIAEGVPMKMVFFRIGWMKRYRGLDDEGILGGGSFVVKAGWGGEVFNFRPFNGSVYGLVRPTGQTINLNRLGATDTDDHAAGVLAVWEVKGLSGSQTRFELTPNEYRKMQEHRCTYRRCVVTDALVAPNLAIFRFRDGRWEDEDGHVLNIEEATAARCGVG